MHALLLTSIAAASTSVGGYSTLVLRRRINDLMALGAGVLLEAACLDLIPAALSSATMRGWPRTPVFAFAVVGGIFFYSLERTKAWRLRDGERTAGRIAASFLIIHSMLDGGAIFAAAAVSVKMGLAVALGIVAHDASDGLNTVLLSSAGRSPNWQDYAFLGLDALAPIAGGLIAGHLFK